MSTEFALLQAAGNRYIAIDGRSVEADWSALARSMTRPRFGVGSDGLLVVQPSRRAALRMRVFNSDGSEAEMSGNGLRLFAKFALDRGLADLERGELRVETGAGLRSVWPTLEAGRMASGRIALGVPVFDPAAIPLAVGRPELEPDPRPPRARLDAAGRSLELLCLSLGNPHAVAIVDGPVEAFPLEAVGPLVQTHPLFPNRVNFEIVNVLDRGRLRARIFERGEGETLSSGTGSTACAVAARASGRVDDGVVVELRGGSLRVEWDGSGEAFLEGPVVEVFRGCWG
ncbi:MAG: diaminopimelate epimerase [Myxococcota bacterium]